MKIYYHTYMTINIFKYVYNIKLRGAVYRESSSSREVLNIDYLLV